MMNRFIENGEGKKIYLTEVSFHTLIIFCGP